MVTLKYSIGLLALSLLQLLELPGTEALTVTDQLYFIISTEACPVTEPHTPISLLVCIRPKT